MSGGSGGAAAAGNTVCSATRCAGSEPVRPTIRSAERRRARSASQRPCRGTRIPAEHTQHCHRRDRHDGGGDPCHRRPPRSRPARCPALVSWDHCMCVPYDASGNGSFVLRWRKPTARAAGTIPELEAWRRPTVRTGERSSRMIRSSHPGLPGSSIPGPAGRAHPATHPGDDTDRVTIRGPSARPPAAAWFAGLPVGLAGVLRGAPLTVSLLATLWVIGAATGSLLNGPSAVSAGGDRCGSGRPCAGPVVDAAHLRVVVRGSGWLPVRDGAAPGTGATGGTTAGHRPDRRCCC